MNITLEKCKDIESLLTNRRISLRQQLSKAILRRAKLEKEFADAEDACDQIAKVVSDLESQAELELVRREFATRRG